MRHRALHRARYATLHAWLLVFPTTLCCDWSGGSVPVVEAWNDQRNIASAALFGHAFFSCFIFFGMGGACGRVFMFFFVGSGLISGFLNSCSAVPCQRTKKKEGALSLFETVVMYPRVLPTPKDYVLRG